MTIISALDLHKTVTLFYYGKSIQVHKGCNMVSFLSGFKDVLSDPTNYKANVAANQARDIATRRGLPDTVIATAEAAAIGSVCANRQDRVLP